MKQQKVGIILIWLKRIAPFLLIALLYFGYNYFKNKRYNHRIAQEKQYALITAQAWVGSVKYREKPEEYLRFRDSLLAEHNLTNDSLKMFIASYENKAENLGEMTLLIKSYIDSLFIIEDSLKLIADSVALVDTLPEIDSTALDSL